MSVDCIPYEQDLHGDLDVAMVAMKCKLVVRCRLHVFGWHDFLGFITSVTFGQPVLFFACTYTMKQASIQYTVEFEWQNQIWSNLQQLRAHQLLSVETKHFPFCKKQSLATRASTNLVVQNRHEHG